LTAPERLGRQIYLRGSGASGEPIIAMLGDSDVSVPASSLPCVNCHGEDGTGRPEGGIAPSDITWEALSKPYGVQARSGRRHPPYDERSLARAIRQGIDPAGNRLLTVMPQFRISDADIENLIAYLKRIRTYQDPGLTEGTIRVGMMLPFPGPQRAAAEGAAALIRAYFEEVNANGGIYNRKIELRPIEPEQEALLAGTGDSEPFVLLSPFVWGEHSRVIGEAEQKEIPVVAPVTQVIQPGLRYTFYLVAGLNEQASVLADYAVNSLLHPGDPVTIVHSEDGTLSEIAKGIGQRLEAAGVRPRTIAYDGQLKPEAVVQTLRRTDVRAVFLLGMEEEQRSLAQAVQSSHWQPVVLIPGALAGRGSLVDLARSSRALYLSFPFLPSDQTEEGRFFLQQLLARHQLKLRHPTFQVWSLAAAEVLVEALRMSGRQLSRQKLVLSLEGLYEFQSGLLPPITYGPQRRIGVLGAYVVRVEPGQNGLVQVTGWISAEAKPPAQRELR
jgi:ABC-type branched-subunit amino acid transport system substrate-binding protein